MSASERRITPDDIISMETYGRERNAHRARVMELKKNRRISVGPLCTVYFESYDTMWFQVHEMLYVERGGEDQIADELAAYNPLIPQGDELTATVMFEIVDPVRRERVLSELTGVEDRIFIELGGERIAAVPEIDVERTKETGKTSSVHFVHFPFSAEQARKFNHPGERVIVGIDHDQYNHMAVLIADQKAALGADLG